MTQKRIVFADWFFEMHENDHFQLDDFDNKQNCHNLGSEIQRFIVEKPLYPQCVTVYGQAGSMQFLLFR